MDAIRASQQVFCSNAVHAEVADAALGYFRVVDNPKAHAGKAVDALARLRHSVEPLGPDRLVVLKEPGPGPQHIEFS